MKINKMKIKYSLFLAILIFFNIFAFSQEQKNEKVILFFVPQYLITNGIRLDIDIRKPDSNKWWIISPYYYSDGSSSSSLNPSDQYEYNPHSYEKMLGYGLGISRKIFITKNSYKGLYASLGINYKYFAIKGDNFNYVEITGDDGLVYYEMQDINYTVNINSYNGYAIIGQQFNPFSKFYIDLFLGFGIKYSTHSSPENVVIKYNRGNIDYGYSGTQLIGGVRLGVAVF